MFSQIINCGFVEITPNQSNNQTTHVDKLDIISVEEQGCEEDSRRSFHRKCCEANKTRRRRRDCFRRNKIAPAYRLSISSPSKPQMKRGKIVSWFCRALQLALLNENFTRKAAWTPKQQVSESDASDNEKATARSFSSKISNAWKVSRQTEHFTQR